MPRFVAVPVQPALGGSRKARTNSTVAVAAPILPAVTMFEALRVRAFALLWTGQSISRLGDSVYRIALAWWVLEETGSPRAMGAVLVFSFTPMLVFLLIGGVVVDRLPRVAIMLASDMGRGLLVAGVAVLASTDTLEMWHVYAASTGFGFVDAFFQPAYAALVPQVTPEERRTSANSLTAVSQQTIGIAGPALGALLVATGGTSVAFALDSASFFASAAFLALMPGRTQRPGAGEVSQGFLTDIRAGIRAVLVHPFLWVTIAVAALANVTLSGPHNVALPFLIEDDRGEGVSAFGLILSATAIGATLAAFVIGRKRTLRKRGAVIYTAWVAAGALMTVYALDVPLWVLLGVAALEGACLTTFGLAWTGAVQELVPGHLQGRVWSIDNLGSYGLLPLGYAAAGWATDSWGAPAVLAAGGMATAALAMVGAAHPRVRGLD